MPGRSKEAEYGPFGRLVYGRPSANISHFHNFPFGPQDKGVEDEGKKREEMGNMVAGGAEERRRRKSVKRSGGGALSPPPASTADSTLQRLVNSLGFEVMFAPSAYSGRGLRESLTPLD